MNGGGDSVYCYIFFLINQRPPRSTRTDTLFPYTTRFRSMICGHEVIGLAGPEERMILVAETQIFLLIKPLRLDAGYKARIGAHGDIDVPGLERAHHLIAAERKGSVASVRRLEPCGRMQRRQNDEVGDVRSSDDELALESVR